MELVLDCETTIHANGNPFSERNKLCYVGLLSPPSSNLYPIEFTSSPYGRNLSDIQSKLNDCSVLIGFNIKFDLHWIKRYGIDFTNCRIWDCQLVHFILTCQQNPYPSLNEVASFYGLGTKLDIINDKYWSKGIDTTIIPAELLEEYLQKDLELTHQVYLKQKEEVEKLSPAVQNLIKLHNMDLLVLQEIEYNGMLFDEETSLKLGADLSVSIEAIDNELSGLHGISGFNLNSGDHLSCLLYGGSIVIPHKEIIGIYKTGERKGQPKEGWVNVTTNLPQLVKPLKSSELKKEGYWATNEATLKALHATGIAKKYITRILERALLEKRVGTYYKGLPALRVAMDWAPGIIHGVLNQCVARTGRLSSSKPNLQNFDGEIKNLFRSRYE